MKFCPGPNPDWASPTGDEPGMPNWGCSLSASASVEKPRVLRSLEVITDTGEMVSPRV